MKRLLLLVLTSLLPCMAQYRVLVADDSSYSFRWLRTGPNIAITSTGFDCIVPVIVPASVPTAVVTFPTAGQITFTLTVTEVVKAIQVFRNGILLTDAVKPSGVPDYTTSVDRKTIIFASVHAGVVGDIVVILVYR